MIDGQETIDIDMDAENRFNAHPSPNARVNMAHERIRSAMKILHKELNLLVSPGRECALAMTKLEESSFWANAGIARRGHTPERSDDGTIICVQTPSEATASDDSN